MRKIPDNALPFIRVEVNGRQVEIFRPFGFRVDGKPLKHAKCMEWFGIPYTTARNRLLRFYSGEEGTTIERCLSKEGMPKIGIKKPKPKYNVKSSNEWLRAKL